MTVETTGERQDRDAAVIGSRSHSLLGLARGWHRRGHPDRALEHLRHAIELDPELQGAYVELARVLTHQRRWRDTVDFCEDALARFPNRELLHKFLIRALTEVAGHDAALARYELQRLDDRPLDTARGDVLGCIVVRNEVDRLPWFLAAQRRLGVSTFIVVDNGSTDGSLEFLRDQPDVRLWSTTMSFRQGNFGSAWFEVLLSRHGVGRWILMLDADEVFTFPGDDRLGIRELCLDLDRAGMRAMSGLMLDMYGREPVADTHYVRGDDFLDHCRYFDRRTHHDDVSEAGVFSNQTLHFGGARSRVFGSATRFLQTKTPLIRYDVDVVLAGGQHWTSHPAERIAHDGGAVLHFKFFSSFVGYARQEAERDEHADGAEQYISYAKGLENDGLSFYDPDESIEFESAEQLVELGVIDQAWRTAGQVPPIPRVAARQGVTEVDWSVMITVYRRLHTLDRAVRSVLAQAGDDMQIAVVADRSDADTHARIDDIIAAIPGAADRLEFHQLDEAAGHPGIFNRAIDLARGDWVHILHDDDYVNPGYYEALRRGVAADPDIGAAFTRHTIDSGLSRHSTSWLERETAGVIDDWLDRIAMECRTQFSAVAVRRAVFEQLGGFRPGIGSAFDWEMWQRIAGRHRVWFDPQPLAVIGRDGSAETDRLMTDGNQVRDAIAAIEHARGTLPTDRVPHLTDRAREHFALRGVTLAGTQIGAGYPVGALINIAAALDAADSSVVIDALRTMLNDALGDDESEGDE